LRNAGILSQAMTILGASIEDTLSRHVLPDIKIGYVCFVDDEVLSQSENAEKIIYEMKL